MYQTLESDGISTAGQRGIHILGLLAHEGLICFATHQGKQPAFALFDEWIPTSRTPSRDEALAELATRYFTSHGPATLQDFIWWSGLPAASARQAVASIKSQLTEEVIDGKTFWLSLSAPKDASPTAHLLPAFDEYTVAYRDRSAVIDPGHTQQLGFGILGPIIIHGPSSANWDIDLGAVSITDYFHQTAFSLYFTEEQPAPPTAADNGLINGRNKFNGSGMYEEFILKRG